MQALALQREHGVAVAHEHHRNARDLDADHVAWPQVGELGDRMPRHATSLPSAPMPYVFIFV